MNNPEAQLIDVLLRMYGVNHDGVVSINEHELAKVMRTSVLYVEKILNNLAGRKVIDYQQQLQSPSVNGVGR
jgi:hypothetical protein